LEEPLDAKPGLLFFGRGISLGFGFEYPSTLQCFGRSSWAVEPGVVVLDIVEFVVYGLFPAF
jgi:hypothetical protein